MFITGGFMKKLTAALLCGFTCTGVLAARADGETMESLPVINRNICISKIEKPMKAEIQSHYDLHFNGAENYETGSITVGDKTVAYRFYKEMPFVADPIDVEYQSMNIYIPEAYFHNEAVGRYTKDSAPIFFPNSIGGYMPAKPGTLEAGRGNGMSASAYALVRGYVVAAPGTRGRTNTISKNGETVYIGKAPAGIVDLQAAVAYLHANDNVMPGNAERIISNGTSAGGAYSLLVGAAGNSKDMTLYLEALGAAKARTDIYAVSAFCPITNLEHADMAYEWSYNGVNEYENHMTGGMLPVASAGDLPPAALGDGTGQNLAAGKASEKKTEKMKLADDQIRYSALLKKEFPAYVNSLELKDAKGQRLTMNEDGTGTFLDYAKSWIIRSAEQAKAGGADISSADFLLYGDGHAGKIIGIDWLRYNTAVGRMKTPGAFDGRDNTVGENNEFGTSVINNMHFTDTAVMYATDGTNLRAHPHIVNMMNPMYYLGKKQVDNAKYWRIRYGEADNNTSMTIPLMAATKAMNLGYEVDVEFPWNVGHSGDYDLENLFDWMDSIVNK